MTKVSFIILLTIIAMAFLTAIVFAKTLEVGPSRTVRPVMACGIYDDGSERGVPIPINVKIDGTLN